jgi:hypothetical protein
LSCSTCTARCGRSSAFGRSRVETTTRTY